MNIEIKKLSPELINDYIEFFEKKAFTDNPEWEGCYCVWYHWNDKLEEARKACSADGDVNFKRDLAIQYIQNGTLQGYLAYLDGSVAGWCNTNDKGNYDALSREKCPELWDDADSTQKIKLIVCFTIAPGMRRKGIATELLKRVCQDAAAEGYTCIEAYPGKGDTNERSYHGPYIIYEKCGFAACKDIGGDVIVRRYLTDAIR